MTRFRLPDLSDWINQALGAQRYRYSHECGCWQTIVHEWPGTIAEPGGKVWHAVEGETERELDRLTLLRPIGGKGETGRRVMRRYHC